MRITAQLLHVADHCLVLSERAEACHGRCGGGDLYGAEDPAAYQVARHIERVRFQRREAVHCCAADRRTAAMKANTHPSFLQQGPLNCGHYALPQRSGACFSGLLASAVLACAPTRPALPVTAAARSKIEPNREDLFALFHK